MANTFTAAFAQTPKTDVAVVSAAMALTGAGSIADTAPSGAVKLVTAGANGAIVTKLTCTSRVTNTQLVGFLFIRRAADAATALVLIDNILVAANTLSATSKSVTYTFTNVSESLPIRLGAGDELHVGISVATVGGVTFYAEHSDF